MVWYIRINFMFYLELMCFIITNYIASLSKRKLLKHLFDDYNTFERPVVNESHTVQVKFGMKVLQILEIVNYFKIFHLEIFFIYLYL